VAVNLDEKSALRRPIRQTAGKFTKMGIRDWSASASCLIYHPPGYLNLVRTFAKINNSVSKRIDMKFYLSISIALLFHALSPGCSGTAPDQTASSNTSETGQTAAATQAAGTDPDSLPFPIYAKFADIELFFQKNDDTTYVINFWATWCKPCVAELPYFEQLHQAYQNQPVKVLLVSMDFPKDLHKKLLPFVRERKLQAPVLALIDMDYNAWIDRVSEKWDGAIPFTVIYRNKNREIKLGEMDGYGELEGLVKRVME
jgi:thiol-disulfide isomerase/thioredoxin